MLLSVGLLGVGYAWPLEQELNWRHPPENTGEGGDVLETWPGGTAVRRWSAEAVAKARAEGRVILVDFTADWCLTCQLNARRALK